MRIADAIKYRVVRSIILAPGIGGCRRAPLLRRTDGQLKHPALHELLVTITERNGEANDAAER
jgi:hypothetical protein